MEYQLFQNKIKAKKVFLYTVLVVLTVILFGLLPNRSTDNKIFAGNAPGAPPGIPGQTCTYYPGSFTGGYNFCENGCVMNALYIYDSSGICSYPPQGDHEPHVCCPTGTYCQEWNVNTSSQTASCEPWPQCPGGPGYCGDSQGGGAGACSATGGADTESHNTVGDNWCNAQHGLPPGSGYYCYNSCRPPAATNTPIPTATPVASTATPAPPTPTPPPGGPAATATPAPPTPTPPPGGPAATATPAPTSPPGAPTATPTRTPTPTSVPTPTVTPPPYADDMCKCDGIELDKEVIVPGDKLTVTAYARVLAENSNYAIVKEMLFSSGKGNGNSYTMDNADMPIVKPVTLIPNTPGKVRYKSTWEYTVPSVLVPNVRYKIWTQPRCAQRTAYSYSSYASVVKSPNVLSAHTANTTFWGMITNFFSGLFGGQPQSNNGSVTPTSTPVPSASRKTIQLDTIKFGKITETDRCQTIYYEASSTL